MPFQKGHKLSKDKGRKPASLEMKYFEKLDAALPEAVDFCLTVIKDTKKKLLDKELKQKDIIDLQQVGLKACQILTNKAPDRVKHSGDENNPVQVSVVYLPTPNPSDE